MSATSNGAKHSLHNLFFKFGISRDTSSSGCLRIITLWIDRQYIAQLWENEIEELRKIARKRRAAYVIRDARGHIIERGNYNAD